VDEAHGSHLRFLQLDQYQDAIECGADIVVQSTHKTLTSLSQTAMLHVGPSSFQYDEMSSFSDGSKSIENTIDGNESADVLVKRRNEQQQQQQQRAIDLIQQYYSMLTTTSANGMYIC